VSNNITEAEIDKLIGSLPNVDPHCALCDKPLNLFAELNPGKIRMHPECKNRLKIALNTT